MPVKVVFSTEDNFRDQVDDIFPRLKEAGKLIMAAAKRNCPVLDQNFSRLAPMGKSGNRQKAYKRQIPGALRDSIRMTSSKKRLWVGILAGNDNIYYARFVEFGHKSRSGTDVKAFHFMQRAMEENREGAMSILRGEG